MSAPTLLGLLRLIFHTSRKNFIDISTVEILLDEATESEKKLRKVGVKVWRRQWKRAFIALASWTGLPNRARRKLSKLGSDS